MTFENRVLRKTFGSIRAIGNRRLETSTRWEVWWFVLHTRRSNRELHNRICDTMRQKWNAYRLWWGNLHEVDHVEDLGVGGKITLRWILRNRTRGVEGTDLATAETSGGLLWLHESQFGSTKWGISELAEELSASHECPCSVQLSGQLDVSKDALKSSIWPVTTEFSVPLFSTPWCCPTLQSSRYRSCMDSGGPWLVIPENVFHVFLPVPPVKVKFNLEQATKAKRGRRDIALLFL